MNPCGAGAAHLWVDFSEEVKVERVVPLFDALLRTEDGNNNQIRADLAERCHSLAGSRCERDGRWGQVKFETVRLDVGEVDGDVEDILSRTRRTTRVGERI